MCGSDSGPDVGANPRGDFLLGLEAEEYADTPHKSGIQVLAEMLGEPLPFCALVFIHGVSLHRHVWLVRFQRALFIWSVYDFYY